MTSRFFAAAAAVVLTAAVIGGCSSSELDPPKYTIVKNSSPADGSSVDSASEPSGSEGGSTSDVSYVADSEPAESSSKAASSKPGSSKATSSKSTSSKSISSKTNSSGAESSKPEDSSASVSGGFSLAEHYSDEVIAIPATATDLPILDLILCKEVKRFEVAAGNPAYCSVDGVLYSRDMTTLIKLPRKFEHNSYTVPDSVKKLGQQSLLGCSGLESIVLPDGLTEIGKFAFNDTHITSVAIPASVEKVDVGAFQRCTYMQHIYVAWKTRPAGWHWAWQSCPAVIHYGK